MIEKFFGHRFSVTFLEVSKKFLMWVEIENKSPLENVSRIFLTKKNHLRISQMSVP